MIRTRPRIIVLLGFCLGIAVAPALAQVVPQTSMTDADAAKHRTLLDQAHAAVDAQDFAGAEIAYRGALEIETRSFGPDAPALGETLLDLALEVSNQSRFDESGALFRRAEPIIDATSNSGLRARLALYRAMDAANQRDYDTAMKYARDAAIAHQDEVNKVRSGAADANGNLPVVPAAMAGELARSLRLEAEMALRQGDYAEAQAFAEQSLYILADQPNLPLSWRPQMIALMGDINSGQARTVEAEKDYVLALATAKKLFGDNGPDTIAIQFKIGRFYAGEQLYSPALVAYRAAFAALDQNPAASEAVTPDQIIPFLEAASAGTPDAATEAAMFAASQRVGTGVEGQTIARVAARRAAENPALAAEVRASEDASRAAAEPRLALATEHAMPDDERDSAREKALADALPGAEQKATALAAKLRTDFPAYTRLAEPAPVTLAALEKSLRPHEAFVSYLIGVKSGFVLLVTSQGLTVRPIPAGVMEIAANIAAVRAAMAPRLGKLPDFNNEAAFALYRDLLAPVEPELAGIDHLSIAANGDLANLPFALLLTADPGKSHDYVHAPWLVRRLAVSSVPSAARSWPCARRRRGRRRGRCWRSAIPAFTACAGPALNALATACQRGGPADASCCAPCRRLPDTAGEVQAVARDLHADPDDMLLGAGASEAALRAKPLDQYAVLYFATHGLLPGELHCQAEPGLVLSPPVSAPASTTDRTDSDGSRDRRAAS